MELVRITHTLCFQLIFSLQIAIKNLHKKAASKDYLTKFLPREIEVLQMVHHPNILQVYQIIESEDKCYFMLEIAENGDLLDYINSRGRIPEEEARSVFKQMTSAIDFCHSIGVVHRDLKCENVMISKDMQIKVGGKFLLRHVCFACLILPSSYLQILALLSTL